MSTPHTDSKAEVLQFSPPPWLRNAHLQSIVPSLPLRRPWVARRTARVIAASREVILDCGDDVRLLALVATQEAAGRPPARELVVLHHGWEGSAESLYILSLADALFARGYDVVRLNLRDHGPTHHLNPGLFHSCRIAEVVGAVRAIQALHPGRRLSLAGFSLGGNFALRVGARAAAAGLSLRRIVAVCPVIDPAATLEVLEHGPALYREYFLLKWKRSLRTKQELWPGHYDFRDMRRMRSMTELTAAMVAMHGEFPGLQAYLNGYAITGDALATLDTESRIITALDDPIIPARDLARIGHVPALRTTVTHFGGHCGFVESLRGPSWIDREVIAELERP
jgi:hypothetical protein